MAVSSGTTFSHIGSDPSAETCPAPELPKLLPTSNPIPVSLRLGPHSDSSPSHIPSRNQAPFSRLIPQAPRFGQFPRPWPLGFWSLPQASFPWSHIPATSQASSPLTPRSSQFPTQSTLGSRSLLQASSPRLRPSANSPSLRTLAPHLGPFLKPQSDDPWTPRSSPSPLTPGRFPISSPLALELRPLAQAPVDWSLQLAPCSKHSLLSPTN